MLRFIYFNFKKLCNKVEQWFEKGSKLNTFLKEPVNLILD